MPALVTVFTPALSKQLLPMIVLALSSNGLMPWMAIKSRPLASLRAQPSPNACSTPSWYSSFSIMNSLDVRMV